MLGEGPHIHIPFSTKIVMFRRIFHFHSRPQTKHKPFRTMLGRGNYVGNYPPVGVVEGYRDVEVHVKGVKMLIPPGL